MFYKKEIDGLRALAVFAVIFYHASLQFLGYRILPGGFLGVDVFFAISGFLIAFVLLEKQTGILAFFKSRFDRIYPTLVLVLCLSCAAAYLWLTPEDMLKYLETLKGALGFYSNHVFAAEDSYVSDSSHYKPLIHTWSLSVEWQFYCLIPFVLLLARKALGRWFPIALLTALVLSLAAMLHITKVDQTKAFYFGIYRFWEMLAGALTYLIFRSRAQRNATTTNTRTSLADAALSALGLATIIACICLFDDKSAHPGIPNLLAIAGTCVFILYSAPTQALSRLLNLAPLAYAGLISYTLYIVHQPVFAFYRVAHAEINNRSFLALLALIVALSALIYHLYEAPMRKARSHAKYVVILIGVLACFAFAYQGKQSKGFADRQPEAIRDALTNYAVPEFRRLQQSPPGKGFFGEEAKEQCIHRLPASACNFGSVAAITLGDSNVGMYEYALQDALAKKGRGILSLSYEQCPLYNQPIWSGNVRECWEINKERWKLLRAYPDRPTVIVSANFYQFTVAKRAPENFSPTSTLQESAPVPEGEVYASFNASIDELLKLGYPVVVVTDVPNAPFDVKKEMERRAALKTWAKHDEYVPYEHRDTFDARAAQIHPHPGQRFQLVRPDRFLCNAERTECLVISRKGGIYSFESHLSNAGVHYLLPTLLESISRFDRQ